MGNEYNFLESLSNGASVFLIGMIVVFAGIFIIVLAITLVGKVINSLGLDGSKKAAKTVATTETVSEDVVVEEGIPTEIKVAIIAAVTSYYFTEQKSNCDFVVKKIRRI